MSRDRWGAIGEALCRQLIEMAPDAIVVADEEGSVKVVNGQTESLFQWNRTELLGQPIEMLLPERFRDTHRGQGQGYFAAPRVRPLGVDLSLCGLRRDGSELPVEISLSPIRTEGRLLVMAVVRDVTESRLAERRLAENAAELALSTKFSDALGEQGRTPSSGCRRRRVACRPS